MFKAGSHTVLRRDRIAEWILRHGVGTLHDETGLVVSAYASSCATGAGEWKVKLYGSASSSETVYTKLINQASQGAVKYEALVKLARVQDSQAVLDNTRASRSLAQNKKPCFDNGMGCAHELECDRDSMLALARRDSPEPLPFTIGHASSVKRASLDCTPTRVAQSLPLLPAGRYHNGSSVLFASWRTSGACPTVYSNAELGREQHAQPDSRCGGSLLPPVVTLSGGQGGTGLVPAAVLGFGQAEQDVGLASSSWRNSGRFKAIINADNAGKNNGSWLEARRSAAWERVEQLCGSDRHECARRDIYQFGVYLGDSMALLSERMPQRKVPFRRMWGFDSFAGLPSEEASVPSSSVYFKRRHSGDYQAGHYNAADALGIYSVNQLKARLSAKVNDSRVRWVTGFFNASLTPQLARKMAPALLVDADADLYSSTVQSLGWMCAHRLLVRGTVIYYDDWAAGGPHGQQRAHAEIASAFNVSFEQVPVTATAGSGRRKLKLADRVAVFEVRDTPWSQIQVPASRTY